MVRRYIVERREANKQGVFGGWHQVGVALEADLQKTDKPRGYQLEYRVIAINCGGGAVMRQEELTASKGDSKL